MAITNRTDAPQDGGGIVGRAIEELAIFPPDDPLEGGAVVDLSQPIPVYRLTVDLDVADGDAPIETEQTGWRYLLERGSGDVSYADVFQEGEITRFSSVSRNSTAQTLLEAAHQAEALAAELPEACEFRIIEAPGSRVSAVWLHCEAPRFIPYIDGTVRQEALLQVLDWPAFRSALQQRLQPKPDPAAGPDPLR